MDPFRDELLSVRSRFDQLWGAAFETRRQLVELVEALPVLGSQLEERGMVAPAMPEVEVAELPELPTDVTLKQALEGCAELERIGARLTEERDQLAQFMRVLNDRLAGRDNAEGLELGRPPRAVPAPLMLVNIFEWRWLHVFILAMWATTFIIVFFKNPLAYGIVGVVLAGGIAVWQLRSAVRRFCILRWGSVASVTVLESRSSSTTSYSGVPMPRAHGWEVTRGAYSGSQYRNVLRYATGDGFVGELVFKGRPYEDGVVLYDTRAPSRAMCVDRFHGNPTPDHRGEWTFSPRLLDWFGELAMVALLAGYIGGMVKMAMLR